MRLSDILNWFRRKPVDETTTPEVPPSPRAGTDHVVILDGTMSSLDAGQETNAGITFRLLSEARLHHRLSLFYEQGLQWRGWGQAVDVAAGRGLDDQIRRAYGFLASRYRPGDRIFLFGYSRGAYGVRSLAGFIDGVGLLRQEEATERAVLAAFRAYQAGQDHPAIRALCHPEVVIEMVGVWDTVKALGIRLPFLWRFTEADHVFHDHRLGASVRHGFHALALDETREVFAPVLWETTPDNRDRVEQVWFRGGHGDVGGQIGGLLAARPLANIPLVWMLGKAEGCGLPLPHGWHDRFPQDPRAPMSGTWHGWGKIFLARRTRRVGVDPSERIHPSALPVPPAGI